MRAVSVTFHAVVSDCPTCVRTFDRGGHDEQSITMPVTQPKRRAGVAAWEFAASLFQRTYNPRVSSAREQPRWQANFQVSASTRAGVPISVSVLNTRDSQSDCACRGHGQACLDRRILLVSQTFVESIQLFIWNGRSVVSEETQTFQTARKLVEAPSNSTTKIAQSLEAFDACGNTNHGACLVIHWCQSPHEEPFSTWKIIQSSKCFSSTFERSVFHDPLDTLALKGLSLTTHAQPALE